ncbi:reactive intermediate/imine deaminase [Robertmurraya siralis]|uniref:Reactive intermediate/imine deaminase n=1 Tax=Robertmurraya siralis TaxID=77777 RepID=A0A920BUU0_9BACI|nr:RidA family protein [Robertmurraya siralis]PAE21083.1 reactive intermediate/imine deaminase [Bacillus sp. 7504-2]GIN62647.1 reactive intermediate/imine deaminase [Robertmurraya siralis]
MEAITTKNAPQALGPYSQAIKVGEYLFLSGQIPINPASNKVEAVGIKEQTRQVMDNIRSILESDELGLENIVKTTIFITDMEQFSIVNEEYGAILGSHRPARSTIEVSRLPKDVLIEIEAIATYAVR